MAHPVAAKSPVGIGRIVSNRQVEQRAELVGLGAAQRQDGFGRPRAHRSESSTTGAAQEAQQQGFGLIVGCVAGEGADADRSASCSSGTRLEVGAVGKFDAFASEWHVEPVRNALGDRCVVGRVGSKAVIDVHRAHIEVSSDSQGNQCGRVGAA